MIPITHKFTLYPRFAHLHAREAVQVRQARRWLREPARPQADNVRRVAVQRGRHRLHQSLASEARARGCV